MPNSSSSAANVPGTGSPSIARCMIVRDVENPSAPASMPSRTMAAMPAMSSGGRGLVAGAALAHDVAAHCAMRHLATDIGDLRQPVDVIEELGERLPTPLDAGCERGARDVLDTLHEPDEPVMSIGCSRREADAAVAHDHGGDAVPARRRQERIPRDLPVVVGVDVDEAGRHQRTVGIDHLASRALDATDVGDGAIGDGDIGGLGRCAGAVDDRAPLDHEVVHGREVTWVRP